MLADEQWRQRHRKREKESRRMLIRKSWRRVRKGLQCLWRHNFDRRREQISRTMKTFLLYNRSSCNGVIHTAFTLHFLHNIAKVASHSCIVCFIFALPWTFAYCRYIKKANNNDRLEFSFKIPLPRGLRTILTWIVRYVTVRRLYVSRRFCVWQVEVLWKHMEQRFFTFFQKCFIICGISSVLSLFISFRNICTNSVILSSSFAHRFIE